MDIHTATEQAYKNGYKAGVKDTVENLKIHFQKFFGNDCDSIFDKVVKEVIGDESNK